jgi:hypothetical protein
MLNNIDRNGKLAQLSPIGWALLFWGSFCLSGFMFPGD